LDQVIAREMRLAREYSTRYLRVISDNVAITADEQNSG
jgi:hypothetical protein